MPSAQATVLALPIAQMGKQAWANKVQDLKEEVNGYGAFIPELDFFSHSVPFKVWNCICGSDF